MAFKISKKNKSKSPLRSTRLAERKRKVRNVKIIFFSVIGAIFIGTFMWLVHVPALNISTIAVSGNSAVDTSDVQKIVSKHILGSYFFIIPKSNKFFYPKSAIKVDVLEAFPRFQSISISTSGSTLSIDVLERTPTYEWCEGTVQTKGPCYSLDTNGYIFGNAPTISGNIFFTFYGLVSTTTPVDTQYMDQAKFKALDKFITSLNTMGLRSYALETETSGTYGLYLEAGGKLLFEAADSYNEDLVNIAAVQKQTDIFTHGQQLDYVDFRFGNKVYYKLVGDNSPVTETEQ